jgi:hypothetical protein
VQHEEIYLSLLGVFPMYRLLNILLLSGILIPFLTRDTLAQERKDISVTVYNSNLGVVKDVRSFDLPKGRSDLKINDVAQLIDATSVKIKFDGEVIEQNYQYDLVSLDKILDRYIDKDIQLISDKGDLIEGTLLSVYGSQVVLKKKDGGLLMLPSIAPYRISVGALPEGLITKPTLQCLFDTKKAGNQNVELTYQTGGMNWHAEYVATLDKDDKTMDLNAWVSIQNNSGVTYPDAKLKLIAGDVNRVQNAVRALYNRASGVMMEAKAAPQFQENALFEYHSYALQRQTTIANNETKQISLFEKENIKVIKKYTFDISQYVSDGENDKVAVTIEFENKENNNLGVPMPKGKVRIYKPDGKTLEFIGEDQIDHTPKDEKVTLKIGDAFDVVAKEITTDNIQITNKVREITYKTTIKNRKTEDVTVEVKKYVGNNWDVKKKSMNYEKIDAETILFKVPVPAGSEKEVTYTIRYTEL